MPIFPNFHSEKKWIITFNQIKKAEMLYLPTQVVPSSLRTKPSSSGHMHLGVTMPTHMWLQFDWWQAEVSEIKPLTWKLYNFCLMIKYEFCIPLTLFREFQNWSSKIILNTWWSRACSIHVHYAGRVAQVLEDFTCLLGYRVVWRHWSCVCWRGYPVGVVKSVLIGCYTEWNFNLKGKEISESATHLQNLCSKWSEEGTQNTPRHAVH